VRDARAHSNYDVETDRGRLELLNLSLAGREEALALRSRKPEARQTCLRCDRMLVHLGATVVNRRLHSEPRQRSKNETTLRLLFARLAKGKRKLVL